jgi:hypothetical protein
LENPPLWVWAIVVSILIVTKLAFRWQATKELVKKGNEQNSVIKKRGDGKSKNLDDNRNRNINNIKSYKYGPARFHKGYFVTRKKQQ